MPVYNKLVRDKIPDIIRNDNKKFTTKILDEKQYTIELKKKLKEELEEYLLASDDFEALGELADILELIRTLSETHGENFAKVEQVRQEKAKKRGGFKERIFLIEVED